MCRRRSTLIDSPESSSNSFPLWMTISSRSNSKRDAKVLHLLGCLLYNCSTLRRFDSKSFATNDNAPPPDRISSKCARMALIRRHTEMSRPSPNTFPKARTTSSSLLFRRSSLEDETRGRVAARLSSSKDVAGKPNCNACVMNTSQTCNNPTARNAGTLNHPYLAVTVEF